MEQSADLSRGSATIKYVQGAPRKLLGYHFPGSLQVPCKVLFSKPANSEAASDVEIVPEDVHDQTFEKDSIPFIA